MKRNEIDFGCLWLMANSVETLFLLYCQIYYNNVVKMLKFTISNQSIYLHNQIFNIPGIIYLYIYIFTRSFIPDS